MISRLLALGFLALASSAALAQTVLGLNDANTLIRFSVSAPGTAVATTPVTGLQGGDTLVGIDVRPASGGLYALAASGRLYTVDPASGAATLASTLSVLPSGAFFAVDFNPVADRLRVISDSGQSLRVNVDTGATLVDGSINPAGPMIGAAAYTNSIPMAPSTALYDIDVASNTLFLQNPPNDGTVVAVGALGVTLDAGGSAGFDILSDGGDSAYAVLRVAATTGLYTIDLASGAATLVGAVGGNPALTGMAIVTAPIVPPAPAAATAIGLSGGNSLIRFAANNPGTVQTPTPVTGLQGGDTLVGIDFRPATGALYGLAASGRLYTIDPSTGVAVLASTLSVAPTGSSFAVDFNPVPDRLRVISDTGQNLRVNVDTGETIVDGPINPAGPTIAAAGYTNSFAGTTSTALFTIDTNGSILNLQSPPNDGTQVAIGPLGATATASSGFDILAGAGGSNTAFGAFSGSLYTVDLTTGEASLVGAIGGSPSFVGLAISPTAIVGPGPGPGPGGPAQPVPTASTWALLLLALGVVGVMVRHRRRQTV
jgi:hypothetical protein